MMRTSRRMRGLFLPVLQALQRNCPEYWARKSISKASRLLQEHKYCISSVAFSPKGNILVSGGCDDLSRNSIHEIYVWEVANNFNLLRALKIESPCNCLAFSADGEILAAGSNNISLFDVTKDFELKKIITEIGVNSLALSRNGKYIAAGLGICYELESKVSVWDSSRNYQLLTTMEHAKMPYPIAFSPDSTVLAVGLKDNRTGLFDTEKNFGLFKTLEGDGFSADSFFLGKQKTALPPLTFSSDGKVLATQDVYGNIFLYDVTKNYAIKKILVRQNIYSWGGGHPAVMAFSPDNKVLAVGIAGAFDKENQQSRND